MRKLLIIQMICVFALTVVVVIVVNQRDNLRAQLQQRDDTIQAHEREIHNLRGAVRDNIATMEALGLIKPGEQPSRGGIERHIFEVTAYTAADWPGNPAYGRTATGHRLSDGDAWCVVAVDPEYWPLGTEFLVPDAAGNWHRVRAIETGSDVVGPDRMDVFVGMANRAEAYEYGRQMVPVVVLK